MRAPKKTIGFNPAIYYCRKKVESVAAKTTFFYGQRIGMIFLTSSGQGFWMLALKNSNHSFDPL
jgi:hypothetical protein